MKIVDAARYLVYLSYHADVKSLTPLKLQKLLYLAQGWNYVWDNQKLFNDEFEAWQYGPVNTEVYDYFKVYKRDEIPEQEGFVPKNATKDELETLQVIWEKYGGFATYSLVELTHRQDPWRKAYREERIIKNSEIKKYFQSTYA